MFHSIRWRLIASFTLLTLLTVTLLGVMVLMLMQRSLVQQANDYLNANARAIAQESQPFFRPMPQTAELSQLAHTAAFLGDLQVRILDDQRQVLVDAGSPADSPAQSWVVGRLPEYAPGERMTGIIVATAPGLDNAAMEGPIAVEAPIAGTAAGLGQVDVFTVHRLPGPWRNQLYLRPLAQEAQFTVSRVLTTSAGIAMFAPSKVAFQATAPIQAGSNIVGYVEMRSTASYVTATLATIQRAFLVAAGVVTVVSIGLGLVVSRGLTAPLEGLAAATNKMNSGDLSARAPVHGRDEIGVLARQFNQMAAALEQSFAALAAERDALRRFIADASHELRTPITALRTFHELLLGSAAHDPAAQREFLLEGQGQLDRLGRITANLLNLSRLDGGLVQLTLLEHDLGDLTAAVVGSFKTLAQERQIELKSLAPPGPVTARVDRTQVETALSNLVDNALKFTPAGGQVQVGVGEADGAAQIWVEDNGLGIAADELPHIFDRFHRGRDAQGEGSGLGLAIVQSIVQAHGGRVEVTSQTGVGTRMTIVFAAKA